MSKVWGKSNSTLTQEQLQALGCIGKDLPNVTTVPPASYPPLMSKPVPFEISTAENYKILWKEDFLNHMRVSPYHHNVTLQTKKQMRDNYLKDKCNIDLPLGLLPNELKVNGRKRNIQEHKTPKIVKTADECLKILEKKENLEKNTKQEMESESEAQEDDLEDDEMDDENDYGNNYFDNGEAFNEEDDNLDDGPVY